MQGLVKPVFHTSLHRVAVALGAEYMSRVRDSYHKRGLNKLKNPFTSKPIFLLKFILREF